MLRKKRTIRRNFLINGFDFLVRFASRQNERKKDFFVIYVAKKGNWINKTLLILFSIAEKRTKKV
jgi:hypothetical protein